MTITSILASDTTSVLAWPVAILEALGLLSLGMIPVNVTRGRRRWWGLTLAMLPTIVGGIVLLYLMSAGAVLTLDVIAAFPFVCGICSLILWSRKKTE